MHQVRSAGPRGVLHPLSAGLAWLALIGTLVLMFVGALVTTHGAGMAVPDWPLSFGQINPPGWWEDFAIRLEHGHRLIGATIGFLVLLTAIFVWLSHKDRTSRLFAVSALFVVILQGVLGGVRVVFNSVELAIVHGCVAHTFFALLLCFALRLSLGPAQGGHEPFPRFFALLLVLLLVGQLVVAAVMRHSGAGLAIPDFPLAFGRLWPEIRNFAVGIHFSHRVLGYTIAAIVWGGTAWLWLFGFASRQRVYLTWISFLVALQIALGARLIWGGRPSLETSSHVVVGAWILGLAIAMTVRWGGPAIALGRANSPQALSLARGGVF